MHQQQLIALTGSTGQVGKELMTLTPVKPLIARLDKSLTGLLGELSASKANVVINAAAYNQVDAAEKDQQSAFDINGHAPKAIAEWCNQRSNRMIHYSSDYVFDGFSKEPYTEASDTNPINNYGRSKRTGELSVMGSCSKGVIFRTSWVLGASGNNFVRTILRLGLSNNSLNVVDDQWGRPTSALILAKATLEFIEVHENRMDLFHISDSGAPTTWYELAKYALNRATDWGYPGIDSTKIIPVSTLNYGALAARPALSLLDCSKFDKQFDTHRPDWKETTDKVVEACTNEWQ